MIADAASMAARPWDVLSFGEALVDLLPSRRGPLAEVPSFERHPGGAPANVAIGAARLGARTRFLGAVGGDPFGRYVLSALEAEGVDVACSVQVPGLKTGLAFVSLDASGVPRFYSPGEAVAELKVGPEHVERVPFDQVRVVHFSTALLRDPRAREATYVLVERARAAGCVVAFDPNLRLHHWKDPRPLAADVARLLAMADVVKLSDAELSFVTGLADPSEAVRAIVDRGPSIALVTRGPLGAAWARRVRGGIEAGEQGARMVTVIDTTGAGDGFQAALVAGLARIVAGGEGALADRERWERLVQACVEAGSRVCECMGAVAGLPTASALAFDP